MLERLTFAVVRMSVSRPASMPAPGGAPAGAMRMFAQLQAAGLTSEAMMQLPAGPMRAAIEAETNRRAGVPYATLSVDERVALLAGLAALPG